MGLFARDGFVEVQEHAGDSRPCLLWRRRGLAPGGRLQLLEQVQQPTRFIGMGRAGDAEFEREFDSPGLVRTAFALDAIGQGSGKLEKLAVVQQGEGLQRRVRAESSRAGAESTQTLFGYNQPIRERFFRVTARRTFHFIPG